MLGLWGGEAERRHDRGQGGLGGGGGVTVREVVMMGISRVLRG